MVQQRQHTPDIEQLSVYLDGELPEAEAAELKAHLASCQECAAELEELRATTLLLQTLPAVTPPRSFTLSEEQLRQRRFSWFPVMRLASATFAVLLMLTVGIDLAGIVEPAYTEAPEAAISPMSSAGAAAPEMYGDTGLDSANSKLDDDMALRSGAGPTQALQYQVQDGTVNEEPPGAAGIVIAPAPTFMMGESFESRLQGTTVPEGLGGGASPGANFESEAAAGEDPEQTITAASEGISPTDMQNTNPNILNEGQRLDQPTVEEQTSGMETRTPTWLRATQLILTLLLAGSVASWYVSWKREY